MTERISMEEDKLWGCGWSIPFLMESPSPIGFISQYDADCEGIGPLLAAMTYDGGLEYAPVVRFDPEDPQTCQT